MNKTALVLALMAGVLPAQEPTVATERPTAEKAPDASPPWADAVSWRSIGPANMGGRIVDLAIYEKDPKIFWAATASGGLLKTTNNGVTFEHQFDRETTVSIGAVAVAQSNPEIVWVGTGENNPRNSVSYGDGVYKSVDGGKTWKNMGLKATFQTGDLVIHPTDPDTVYVGALGRLYGPNTERGLFKTTDGGKSWRKILYIDDKTGIIDIAMHPKNPDVMLVASYERQRDGFDTNDPAKKIGAGSGLHRTADGGETFQLVEEGLPTCQLGRIGLDWHRANPDVVFAIVESEKIGQVGAKIGYAGVQTENAETGAKITSVTKDSPAAKAGLEKGDIVLAVDGSTVLSNSKFQKALAEREIGDEVRLEIARKGESQEIVVELAKRPKPEGRGSRGGNNSAPYGTRLGGQVANIQDMQGKDGHEHGGVYRSDDAGVTWKRINSINPRPMYFSHIRVDPSDDKFLYVLGISASRSKDGGATFTADFSRGVHADQHALWVDPADGKHMVLGCDGGIYVTYDRGANWAHHNHTALGQFYHVGVGPRRDYWVYGGLQDNGSWGAPHRNARGSGPINENWLRVGSGDGFLCLVDQNDPDQIYYESQNGGMGRTHLRTMESGRIRPATPRRSEGGGEGRQRGQRQRFRFNWRTPFLLSHFNSRIYYCAGNHVFRSLDRGNDLKQISPEITLTDRGSATALAESPRDPDVLYVGSDDGALWGTRDGGKTWTDLLNAGIDEMDATDAAATDTKKPDVRDAVRFAEPGRLKDLIPGPRWVASIEASRAETGRVYVTLDGHRSDDDDPYAFVSEDYGQTWKSLRGNLPRGSTRVLREDIENPDVLYAGTEFGIYASFDRGEEWHRFHGNLPTVAIHEIAQHRESGEIVVATHGRSLWILDATPFRQISPKTQKADAHLFEPNTVVRWVSRHSHGASGGASRFTGTNPGTRGEIYYSLGKDAGSVELTVRNAKGDVVRTLETDTKAGLHRVTWDLRRAQTEKERAAAEQRLRDRFGDRWREYLRWIRNRAPMVSTGTYEVVLEADGKTMRQSIEIVPDPNFPQGTSQGRRSFEDQLDEELDALQRGSRR